MYTTAIIGAGNMGSAIAKALLSTKTISPNFLRIADPDPKKLLFFDEAHCKTSLNSEECIPGSKMIILAVKPQGMAPFLESVRHLFTEETILISIAAGVSVQTIQEKSGVKKVVRVMPNTPAQVQMGVSGVFFSPEGEEEEKAEVSRLLSAFGKVILCEEEEKINAITALSGSGPAYFFRILEILQKEGEVLGFSSEDAKDIALYTLLGAGTLAKESGEDFGTLREKVTSKGGTTAAALESFERDHLDIVLKNGIKSAFLRAKELSQVIS